MKGVMSPKTYRSNIVEHEVGECGGGEEGRGRKGRRTIPAHTRFQLLDLRQCGILAASTEEVAKGGELDSAVATFVEEGEGFFVIG